ncbi:MAG: hypothetical protein ACFB0F_09310 [Neomegalonema sp.]
MTNVADKGDAKWRVAAELWRRREISRKELAAQVGVSETTLRRRAKRMGWDKAAASSQTSDTAARVDAARQLYESLTDALSSALDALRAQPDAVDPKLARERAETIRAHGKALFALIEGLTKLERPRSQAVMASGSHNVRTAHAASEPPDFLDLAAARVEIARRLDRLARSQNG